MLSIGDYPEMGLAATRTAHQRWAAVLADGRNPSAERRTVKKAEAVETKLIEEHSALVKFVPPTTTEKVVVWPDGSFGAVQKESFRKWSDG